MNWKKIICWWRGHKWQVLEGKRHCTFCGHKPKDDGVRFCPKCGSERLMGNIMVSQGYHFTSCKNCDHKFQDTSAAVITVAFGDGCYELKKPMVGQDGKPIGDDEE